MSKQSEAKIAQGYSTTPSNCGNCAHFTADRVPPAWMVESNDWRAKVDSFFVERNLRCGLGDFAVKKTASCGRHQTKAD